MAIKPRDINKDNLTARVQDALEARRGTQQKETFYREVAEAIGCSERAIRNWYEGDNPPEFYYVGRLAAYFGHDFLNETLCDLLGLYCIPKPGRVDSSQKITIQRIRDYLDTIDPQESERTEASLLDDPRVVSLKNEGGVG